ncbi:hypothetical protein [Actinoplanes sp. NPDC026623]|uniref:hypothetical protein n=1 Tax=Actinoplanes sp. NPDC026623 TaxID=3155610 RepID=UPI0033F128A6
MENNQVGDGYPQGQLGSAFVTAVTHEDATTRARAEGRVRRWLRVLAGMVSGTLTIGSRTPVAGLPAWVTPQVVRGGFATGTAAAGGPLRAHEAAVAGKREAVFAHCLTDAGQAELCALLDGGGYRLEFPEQAALLAVAWLLRAGDRARAHGLLQEIGPYAPELCFTPAPDPAGAQDPSVVWRTSAGEVGAALAGRRENARVEAKREALTVWNPFADELLSLWLETRDDGGAVAAVFPPGWHARAGALLGRYEALAAVHTRCGKHRRPKENLAILRAAAREVVDGRDLPPRTRGMLRHVADSMLARRGRPGSAEHAALRLVQEREAEVPAHHLLTRVVVARIARLDPEAGIRDVDAVCVPVGVDEAGLVPAGTPIPEPIRRVVRRATAGRVDELLDAGLLPSAEVLAELVPQLTAEAGAAAYPDPALRALMAATYRAFSRRRSLLLLDLEHQVRWTELPWVRALRPYRQSGDDTRTEAHATLRRLGELALDGFPATLLPNPLVRELAALSREADAGLPWVEELAADIFMGRFSPKFARAAHLAGELLTGTLYARYYDIDYPALPPPGGSSGAAFDALCRARADQPRGHSPVAANGTVIEQAQILTTHNLATLVHSVGVTPAAGWAEPARRAFAAALRLAGRIDGNPRPLPTIKDIAYAWRHLVFFLSLPDAGDPRPLIDGFHADLAAAPAAVRARIGPALVGLGYVAAGGRFTDDRTPAGGRRLLGWTTGQHWMR